MRQIIFFLIIIVLCKPKNCASESTRRDLSTKVVVTVRCDENVLTSYLAEIELTCPENLVEHAVSNLEKSCRRILQELEKFRKYLKTCKVTEQQDLYAALLLGVVTVHDKLCVPTEFLRRYTLFYPCFHELQHDFDGCKGPVDWYEDKDETEICKHYKRIADCYYIKTAKVCGIGAAQTLKELLTDIVDSIIRLKCKTVNSDPVVKDPMPESYLCGKVPTMQSSFKITIFLTSLRMYLF